MRLASVFADFGISHNLSTLFAFGLVFLICVELVRRRRISRLANPRNLPYPPGPKPLPILGNILDVAPDNDSAAYQHLAKQYGEFFFIPFYFKKSFRTSVILTNTKTGDLFFLNVLGKKILFVNSFHMANELFDKRSINYSDRCEFVMSNELYVTIHKASFQIYSYSLPTAWAGTSVLDICDTVS